MRRSCADECLYLGPNIAVLVYVDDFILIGKGLSTIVLVKGALSAKYDMKDLGPAKKFLGLRITRNRVRRELRLDQEEYAESTLERFGFVQVKPRNTPLPPG